jgi:hypothetical protein
MLKEFLDPAASLYSAELISSELSIPIEVIERYKTVGLIEPEIMEGTVTEETHLLLLSEKRE